MIFITDDELKEYCRLRTHENSADITPLSKVEDRAKEYEATIRSRNIEVVLQGQDPCKDCIYRRFASNMQNAEKHDAAIAAQAAIAERENYTEAMMGVLDGVPNDLRQNGWAVAIHNDYRLDGEQHTFWLFTNNEGNYLKGEGKTDAEALNQIRELTRSRRKNREQSAIEDITPEGAVIIQQAKKQERERVLDELSRIIDTAQEPDGSKGELIHITGLHCMIDSLRGEKK